MSAGEQQHKIAELEEKLKQKEDEIQALQVFKILILTILMYLILIILI